MNLQRHYSRNRIGTECLGALGGQWTGYVTGNTYRDRRALAPGPRSKVRTQACAYASDNAEYQSEMPSAVGVEGLNPEAGTLVFIPDAGAFLIPNPIRNCRQATCYRHRRRCAVATTSVSSLRSCSKSLVRVAR
jgi:hypothetical protein